ncbi:MAG: hypothetical protein KOO69_00420, partial [Victivallales bacterium]|nr:hypothetical protein [Victivallales bacterium]
IIVALLSFSTVKKWFRSKNKIRNKSEMKIVIKQRLQTGEHKTISGVFDTEKEEIIDANSWESKRIDYELGKLDRASIIRDIN